MTDSLRLIIAGGNKKGTLYAVCTFLEKYLGCRMYSPSAIIIPEREKYFSERYTINRYRPSGTGQFITSTWNQEYADWHKLSHDATEKEQPGTWVHTFNHLVHRVFRITLSIML